jgi:RNA polymerase sigma-32 factor
MNSSVVMTATKRISARCLDAISPTASLDEEEASARPWRDQRDIDAAHKLVTSHLRLVTKIAMRHRGCDLQVRGPMSVGNFGMMLTARRFDPDRRFRLVASAKWRVRAAIHSYIVPNWSLVSIGATAAQKMLSFNLCRLKGQMQAIHDDDLQPGQIVNIARKLDAFGDHVINMNRSIAPPDCSLNAPIRFDGRGEWLEWLPAEANSHEVLSAERQVLSGRKVLLSGVLTTLNHRERHAIAEHRLKDNPTTLERLSQHYRISREHAGKIEARGLQKLWKSMTAQRWHPAFG